MRTIVVLIVIASCVCKHSEPEPDRAPLTPSQAELPKWFGLPNAPARRIAGNLFDGDAPLAGTVHLRMEAPDATIWRGIDLQTGPDGAFDFGEQRAGRYNILATALGRTSRLVEVDTRAAAAQQLAIYAYACRPTTSTASSEAGKQIVNAEVDIGGVKVATTDGAGKFTVCLTNERMDVTVRAQRF